MVRVPLPFIIKLSILRLLGPEKPSNNRICNSSVSSGKRALNIIPGMEGFKRRSYSRPAQRVKTIFGCGNR